ncbi:hypothetical protein BKA66DRAFT_572965 [Pyrenochaeta sp. MPI-SDFR-AT-0127]|nr:hypothetical protein BKA66DRAFT_572965 [Pyrenochaeta sp. MPI-SDFR-AT-0127]
MVSKNSRSDKEWNLSDAQRRQREQQRQAAEAAQLEKAAYSELFKQFNGELPIGSQFRNAMGNHFEVIPVGADGGWRRRDLSAQEKVPNSGYTWSSSCPVDRSGPSSFWQQLDMYKYEVIMLVKLDINKPEGVQESQMGDPPWIDKNKQDDRADVNGPAICQPDERTTRNLDSERLLDLLGDGDNGYWKGINSGEDLTRGGPPVGAIQPDALGLDIPVALEGLGRFQSQFLRPPTALNNVNQCELFGFNENFNSQLPLQQTNFDNSGLIGCWEKFSDPAVLSSSPRDNMLGTEVGIGCFAPSWPPEARQVSEMCLENCNLPVPPIDAQFRPLTDEELLLCTWQHQDSLNNAFINPDQVMEDTCVTGRDVFAVKAPGVGFQELEHRGAHDPRL